MDDVANIRTKVIAELDRLSVLQVDSSKECYRSLHKKSVQIQLEQNQQWIRRNYPKLAMYFANGEDVIPQRIAPMLVEVREPWHSDLFRLARLTWSLPFTKGYGRRLRFLIIDGSNDKLMGILGLQSPPLDFPARDRLFSYQKDTKTSRINQTMDVYTLGAIPPYNSLLAGKLVAFTAASGEVRDAYRRKYSERITELDKRLLPADLVALTTTSAFGRSSLYNRLTYKDRLIAKPIGYTEGYGSFHLAPLYPLLRDFLETENVSTKGGFGVGPRIVWQTYVRALQRLGLSSDLLKHGVKRQVFLFPLISNLQEYMESNEEYPVYYSQSFWDLAEWWQKRWMLPRTERVDGWHTWNKREIEHALILAKV
ncbi:MAG: Druantia anti-phage system protein DruA [Thermomicrobiales bacterium]